LGAGNSSTWEGPGTGEVDMPFVTGIAIDVIVKGCAAEVFVPFVKGCPADGGAP